MARRTYRMKFDHQFVVPQFQLCEGGVGLECPAAAPSWPILFHPRSSRRQSSGSVHLSPVHHDELIRTSAILQYVSPNVVVNSEEVSSAVMIRRASCVFRAILAANKQRRPNMITSTLYIFLFAFSVRSCFDLSYLSESAQSDTHC